jgi:transposase-like protein
MPPREWIMAKAQLAILFQDRFTRRDDNRPRTEFLTVSSKAIRKTFGRHTPIQRCQVHKARNITERLAKPSHASVPQGCVRRGNSMRPRRRKSWLRITPKTSPTPTLNSKPGPPSLINR